MPPEETAVAARSGHAGEPVPSAEALLQEGILALSREEHQSADALFKQALDLAEAGDDSPGLKATILRHRAQSHFVRCQALKFKLLD